MKIRIMKETDRASVLQMMRVFYNSPAVNTNGSEEIFNNDITECVSESPYAEGYVFEEDNGLSGYAMIAKSFSTEYGRKCVWIEDIYVMPEYRHKGYGRKFFGFINEKYKNSVLRLEAEEENTAAIELYRKSGFDTVPYLELWRLE